MKRSRFKVFSYLTSSGPKVDPKTLTVPTTNLILQDGLTPNQRGIAVKAYALQLFRQYNITDWRFGFDGAKRRAGCCNSGHRLITLSSFFVLHNTAEEIQGTIVHEIAHALAPVTEHHGPIWRAIAIAMGDSGERCYDNKKVIMPKGRFVYVCPNPACAREVHRHKRIGSAGTSCGRCCRKYNGGRYDAKYKLVWKGTQSTMPTPPSVSIPVPSAPLVPEATKTKSDRMKELFDAGTTNIGEIARLTGAHYSHVHTVISKHKLQKAA